jgi:hypothetical protein
MSTRIQAQLLYNLRILTAYISGQDLSELFQHVLGEMSPSGKREFEISDLEAAPWGQETLEELAKKFNLNLLAQMAHDALGNYRTFVLGGDEPQPAAFSMNHYGRKGAVALLKLFQEHFGGDEASQEIGRDSFGQLWGKPMQEALPILSKLIGLSPNFVWLEAA